jgi:HD-GYP domain-containing protein (c-di-GMP phosphodiesterase class II)
MRTISPRWKHLLLLFTVQVGCFAIGLWGHSHIVVSSVHRAAQEAVWQKLSDQTGAPDAETRVLVVDEKWRQQDATASDAGDSGRRPASAEKLAWTRVAAANNSSSLIRGTFQLGGERYVGVAHRRPAGGYRILHVPESSLAVRTGDLLGSLGLAGAITLLWVCAPLGLFVYLIITRLHDEHNRARSQWESQSLAHSQTLQRTRDGIIFGLAKLAEFRDQETGYHLERISACATRLAVGLRRHPKYRDRINNDFIKMIGISSVLHDIGKVGVPDAVLLKPGPLTPDEWVIMRRHTQIGGQCIAEIERRLGNSNFLQMANAIALSHHERWDGTGYPNGLSGEQIPLAARIVAVVDAYDALSSRRVYKAALPHDECIEIIRSEAGRHFDPVFVEVFLKIEPEIRDIAYKYSPESAPSPALPPAPPQPLPRWSRARENEELAASGAVRDDGLWHGATAVVSL